MNCPECGFPENIHSMGCSLRSLPVPPKPFRQPKPDNAWIFSPAAQTRTPVTTSLTREELLVLLIEECGEVIQAATKCLRFGWDIDHGVGYGNNRMILSCEVGDLEAIIRELPLDREASRKTRDAKINKAETAKRLYGKS